MDSLPCLGQLLAVTPYQHDGGVQLRFAHPPRIHHSAILDPDPGLPASTEHVHVRWTVVLHVDNDVETILPEYGSAQ